MPPAFAPQPNCRFNADANTGHVFGIFMASVGALRPAAPVTRDVISQNAMRENINSTGLATYEFREFKQARYKQITKLVVRKFKLEYVGDFLNEKNHQKQKFSKDTKSINIEWELLVGYVIYSNNTHSNSLAKEIAEFVNNKYGL